MNINDLMKQAQDMQQQMQKMQEDASKAEVTGESGAGMVKIVMNGRHDVRKVTIDPSLLTEEKAFLEDLLAPVGRVVFTSPVDAFSARLQLTFILGFLIASPIAMPVSSVVWCKSMCVSPLAFTSKSIKECLDNCSSIWSRKPMPVLILYLPLPSRSTATEMLVSFVFLDIFAFLFIK